MDCSVAQGFWCISQTCCSPWPAPPLQVGMTVHCRIMKIDIEKFSADLTCRTSDLMDKNNEWKLPKDTYYDFDSEAADHKQEEDMKRKQQRTSEFFSFLSPLQFQPPHAAPGQSAQLGTVALKQFLLEG